MTTTWNPSDKHADITLSNGNLDAATTVTSVFRSVRATNFKNTKRKYFEVNIMTAYQGRVFVGISTSSAGLANYVGSDAYGFGYYGFNGQKYFSGAGSSYGSAFIAGDVIGVAVDLDYGTVWFAKNNVWQAGGDPVNNEYPAFVNSIISTYDIYPMASFYTNGDKVRIQTTSSGCTYAPPNWFSYWDAEEYTPSSPKTVWNPFAKHANVTLSNGDMDAANTTTSWRGARAINPRITGKKYFEVKAINMSGNREFYVGIAASSTRVDNPVGFEATTWGYYAYNGNKYNSNVSTSFGSTYTTNDVIGVAVDLDEGKLWWAKNNVWQASGDPASGTNAAYTSSAISSNFIHPGWTANRPGDQGRILATQYDCVYSPPSGFDYWSDYYYFEGHIYERGAPVSRQLYTYRRDTGALIGYTTSSGDGYYYLTVFYNGPQYVVCLDDDAGESYNDLIIGSITPTRSGVQ